LAGKISRFYTLLHILSSHKAEKGYFNVRNKYQDGWRGSMAGTLAFAQVRPAAGIELEPRQADFITLTSIGCSAPQVAGLLGLESGEAQQIREGLTELYCVPTLAAAIDSAIKGGTLPLEVRPDCRVTNQLTKRQVNVIELIAAGYTTKDISDEYGKNPQTVHSNVIRPIFKKVRANTREHIVRRSYELGIFTVPQSVKIN
jgi:DNA-binding CsgD family transcriptional regulator